MLRLVSLLGTFAAVQAGCEVAPDCQTCLSGTVGADCGWCAINTTSATKVGPQCADLSSSVGFDCDIQFQTDKCTDGWKCPTNKTLEIELPSDAGQCVKEVGGIGDKDKCETHCKQPKPPPPPSPPKQAFSCNQTTLTCAKAPFGDPSMEDCQQHCKVTYSCDEDKKMCHKSTPSDPGTQYPDNATCATNCPAKPQPVPYELRGIWRGLSIQNTYGVGEWVANISDKFIEIWYPDAASAAYKTYVKGNTTAFQHMGQYSLEITSTVGKLTGKVRMLAGDYSFNPEVGGFVQFAVDEKNLDKEPQTFDAGMTGGTTTVLSFETCPTGGAPPPKPPPAPPPKPPTPPPPPPTPPPCKAKIDVVVILDGSNSIVDADWARALTFTNKLIDGFNISADQVEMGVVQFSDAADTVIGLSADAAAIHKAVTNLRQMKRNTNTYNGFNQAKSIIDSQGRKDNKGQVVILITDGMQNAGRPAKEVSDALKAEKVEIFGIGVGRAIDKQEIQSWVSTPLSDHYFDVSGFDQLETILQKIIDSACPHPPSAPRAKVAGVDYPFFGSTIGDAGKNCKFHLPTGLPNLAKRSLAIAEEAPRLTLKAANSTDPCNSFPDCPHCIGARAGGKTCGWCTGDLKYAGQTSQYKCAGKDAGTGAATWTCTGHYQTTSCDEAGPCGLEGTYRGLRIDNEYDFGEWSAVFTKEATDDAVKIQSFGIDGKVTGTIEGTVKCVKACSEGKTTAGVPFTLTTKAGDIQHGICGYTDQIQAETSGLMWALAEVGQARSPDDFDSAMLGSAAKPPASVHTYYKCSEYKASICKFKAP